MSVLISVIGIIAAWTLLVLDVEPVPTWFYVFAWYPTLVLLDRAGSALSSERPIYRNIPLALSMLIWSAPVWLLFEAANLRLSNWYYVFLPAAAPERWAGILLSFATVLPALFLAARALQGAGACSGLRSRPVRVRSADLWGSLLLGTASLALTFAYPRVFFPLLWGATLLVTEPLVHLRDPGASLYRDLERGDWGRIARLMLAGLGVGLLWETYNFWARGKWVYTVPWLDGAKLFEMPAIGFAGFPFFALEAWSLYHALVAVRAAVAFGGSAGPPLSRRTVLAAGSAAIALTVVTLMGMERLTISSLAPRLEDVPLLGGAGATGLRTIGVGSVADLAHTPPAAVALAAGIAEGQAARMVDRAALITLAGIGSAHAATLEQLGVRNPCDLSRADAEALAGTMRRSSGRARPTQAETRTWIHAARKHCGGQPR